MMKNHSLTIELNKYLHGLLKPAQLIEKYHLLGREMTESVMGGHLSPLEYVELMDYEAQGSNINSIIEEAGNEWLPAFFVYQSPAPFNDLCIWYRQSLAYECRLIVLQAQHWINDEQVPAELLKFRLRTLQHDLIEVLIALHNRREGAGDDTDFPEETEIDDLEKYVFRIQFMETLALFFELQERFSQLLEDHIITADKLFLSWLRAPVPQNPILFSSAEFVRLKVSHAIYSKNLQALEPLVHRLKNEIRQASDPDIRSVLEEQIQLLQNLYFLFPKDIDDAAAPPLDLLDPEHVKAEIRKINNDILSPSCDLNSPKYLSLLYSLKPFFELFGDSEDELTSESAARVFISDLEKRFEQLSEGDEGEVQENEDGQKVAKLLFHWHKKEDVRKKLGFEPSRFNQLLRDAGVEVAYFTKKNQWLHADDIETLMNNYRKIP